MTIIRRIANARRVSERRWRLWACVLLVCGVMGHPRSGIAQQNYDEPVINREYPLKALFLYNFGGYVEWPAAAFSTSQDPFVIGVLGSAPVDETLKEISASRKIGGRKIVVRRFSSVDGIETCHILFIARDVAPQQQLAAINRFQNYHVLIVGESPGFAERGGSVNFFVEANKIRFEINIDTAKQHQLKISAKLLSLAKIVQGS
ncbi:MAG: YfiR family protein [Planctomycetia bacterium]|nr:YfiR family protein [Planctomycetia bacterium]